MAPLRLKISSTDLAVVPAVSTLNVSGFPDDFGLIGCRPACHQIRKGFHPEQNCVEARCIH